MLFEASRAKAIEKLNHFVENNLIKSYAKVNLGFLTFLFWSLNPSKAWGLVTS